MTKLRRVGGPVTLAIPKAILEGLYLQPDASVGVSVAPGKLMAAPHPRQRYTLAQLLAQSDPDAPRTAEDASWLNDGPVGREAIL